MYRSIADAHVVSVIYKMAMDVNVKNVIYYVYEIDNSVMVFVEKQLGKALVATSVPYPIIGELTAFCSELAVEQNVITASIRQATNVIIDDTMTGLLERKSLPHAMGHTVAKTLQEVAPYALKNLVISLQEVNEEGRYDLPGRLLTQAVGLELPEEASGEKQGEIPKRVLISIGATRVKIIYSAIIENLSIRTSLDHDDFLAGFWSALTVKPSTLHTDFTVFRKLSVDRETSLAVTGAIALIPLIGLPLALGTLFKDSVRQHMKNQRPAVSRALLEFAHTLSSSLAGNQHVTATVVERV